MKGFEILYRLLERTFDGDCSGNQFSATAREDDFDQHFVLIRKYFVAIDDILKPKGSTQVCISVSRRTVSTTAVLVHGCVVPLRRKDQVSSPGENVQQTETPSPTLLFAV